MDDVALARALYRALEGRDVAALLALLSPTFEGRVTEGLPRGWGGARHGPEEMLGLWGEVASSLAIHPRPDEIFVAGDRVVVRGRYVGKATRSGTPLDAAFVHLLTMRDGRIERLEQVTDSARWRDALE